jgi:hypothetical protein
MKSFFQKRLWVVLLATLSLGALTILSLSLNEVPFNEGRRYGPKQPADGPATSPQDVVNIFQDVNLWKAILLFVLIMLMILLVGLLLSAELRKRLFRMMLRTALTAFAVYYLMKNYGDRFLLFPQLFANQPLENPDVVNAQPPPTFQPPQVSSLFSYVVSFAFALLLIVVIWVLYRNWQKYAALHTPKTLDEIARIARTSLNDLSSGRESSDVIISCYLRMSDVVADKQKLHREIAMTPQEFAVRLERAGLPGDAVRRLTRLFEMVRYGDRKSAPKDVTEAVSCLNTILYYCGETI